MGRGRCCGQVGEGELRVQAAVNRGYIVELNEWPACAMETEIQLCDSD